MDEGTHSQLAGVRVEALQQFLATTGETQVEAPALRAALRAAGFRGVRLTHRTP